MTPHGWLQVGLYFVALLAVTKPLGIYVLKVYDGTFRWLRPLELLCYRIAGIHEHDDQHWTQYTGALLLFSGVSMLATYVLLRMQHVLPLNPEALAAVPDRQAFETASSFMTNTNWQSYAGESTMSYFSQMTQLTFHNFASAAVGMGVAVALARGIARRSAGSIGNFWVDLVRGTLYLFLPFCIPVALFFIQQGVIQNFLPYVKAATVEGATQVIAMGPVASQEAIKQLGTNGGGFFNANAAHPFENPTPLTNFVSMLLILAVPSALTYTYGRMVGNQKHGWALWSVMAALLLAGAAVTYQAESGGNPIHAARGVDIVASATQSGGNMEGKEVRFGIANSALYAVITTAASCGAVNAMHDSFTALGGLVPLVNMQLGEVVFGGVGAGLYGMLMMAVLTVFIAGLMVGRTPEYLGKKIRAREVQMVMLYVLAFPLVLLLFAALAVLTPAGLAGLHNAGPHGLSEILYAFSSATANNGSAFAGLTGATYFYNTLLGTATLFGRFALIVPVLALAGFMAEKKTVPASAGTFPVTTPLFVVLLCSLILIIGALTFFPALALGPIVEHLVLRQGGLF